MRKLIAFMAIMLIAATSALALDLTDPVLSGKSDKDVSTTLTITNDGSKDIFDIQLNSSAASKYKITFKNVPSTLKSGKTAKVTW